MTDVDRLEGYHFSFDQNNIKKWQNFVTIEVSYYEINVWRPLAAKF